MTTYTFQPKVSVYFGKWDDPTFWAGGVVPNSADADVVFPVVTASAGTTFTVNDNIASGETFSVRSVKIEGATLDITGQLNVSQALTDQAEINMSGGTLSTGSLTNAAGAQLQGQGTVSVTGTLTNSGQIVGSGLTINASAFANSGRIVAASGDLTLHIADGGFTNLAGGVLTGGTYGAGVGANQANTLYLDVGGVIATDAASIALQGGDIEQFDSNAGHFVSLQSTLTSIAHSGSLVLSGQVFQWANSLTVDGLLDLEAGTVDATLVAPNLVVGNDGTIEGVGEIEAPIENEGVILAGRQNVAGFTGTTDTLVINGSVTGTGSIRILPQVFDIFAESHYFAALELKGAMSGDVIFSDGTGTLILDAPGSFTGAVMPIAGDGILLPGVSIGSVTGYSYAGDASGGTLKIQYAGGASSTVRFKGDFDRGNFSLSAGPQPLSTSPPSLLVTFHSEPVLTSVAPSALYVQGGSSVPVSPDLGVRDTSSSILTGATVMITGGKLAGDQLAAVTTGTSITAAYDSSTETLRLTGSDTLAHYQGVLRSVAYSSMAADPTNGGADPTRTISWTINDGSTLSTQATTQLNIVSPQPAQPAGSIDMFLANQTSGAVQTLDIGSGHILANFPAGQIDPQWQVAAVDHFSGVAGQTDLLMRSRTTGAFRTYGLVNGQIVSLTNAGVVGKDWQTVGFGNFSGVAGETDMLMRQSTTGTFDVFDISGGAITGAHTIGAIGAEWTVAGLGNFSGVAGETDMLMMNSTTGALTIYDIAHDHITGTHNVGAVGTDWQAVGFGAFSGVSGESDMLMRNTASGAFAVLDIAGNTVTGVHNAGTVGLDWDVLGFGNFSGVANETDLLMRNHTSGTLAVFDIAHSTITATHTIGQIGTEWQPAGLADFSGRAGETDLLMRDTTTGAFNLSQITGNAIAANSNIGQVGTDWGVAGFAPV